MAKVLSVDHHVISRSYTRGKRPLVYPGGTKCTTVAFWHSSKFSWTEAIRKARGEWTKQFGEGPYPEEGIFYTIGFTTGKVIIEVSDRMRRED